MCVENQCCQIKNKNKLEFKIFHFLFTELFSGTYYLISELQIDGRVGVPACFVESVKIKFPEFFEFLFVPVKSSENDYVFADAWYQLYLHFFIDVNLSYLIVPEWIATYVTGKVKKRSCSCFAGNSASCNRHVGCKIK